MNHWKNTSREGGSRGGQKDKLNCGTDTTDISADLMGDSGTGIGLWS